MLIIPRGFDNFQALGDIPDFSAANYCQVCVSASQVHKKAH